MNIKMEITAKNAQRDTLVSTAQKRVSFLRMGLPVVKNVTLPVYYVIM